MFVHRTKNHYFNVDYLFLILQFQCHVNSDVFFISDNTDKIYSHLEREEHNPTKMIFNRTNMTYLEYIVKEELAIVVDDYIENG